MITETENNKAEDKTQCQKTARGLVNTITWAACFIWAGLVLIPDKLNFITTSVNWGAWSLIFVGTGIIVLLGILICRIYPKYYRPVGKRLILALVLLGIGLQGVVGWRIIWPVILIAIGVSIALRGIFPPSQAWHDK